MPDALSITFIVIFLGILFIILFGIFGEIIIYLYLGGIVITIFEYFFGALTFYKIISIIIIIPILSILYRQFIRIPLSDYDGKYARENLILDIRSAGDEIEICHNFEIKDNAKIHVNRRSLILGDIKLSLVKNGIKAQFNDGEQIILFRER